MMVESKLLRTLGSVVVALLVATTGVSCGVDATSHPATSTAPATTVDATGPDEQASTSTTVPPIRTIPDPGGPPPDPSIDDVDDSTYGGLGDPRIDVVHYDLTLRADLDNPVVSGVAVIDLAALTSAPLASFTLDLDGPTIEAVTVDGATAQSSAAGEEVTITPAKALVPFQVATVEVTYSGTPAPEFSEGLDTIVGWQRDDEGGWFSMPEPDGTSTWAPVSDHPSDKATWRVTLDTQPGVTGVSNGRLRVQRAEGDRQIWIWAQDNPMATYLALVAIGRYDLVESPTRPGVMAMSAYPVSLPASDRAKFDQHLAMIDFYSEVFGPFPEDDTGVVIVPAGIEVAIETKTRPLISREWLDEFLESVLAHELAHEWFGNSVTPQDWTDLWLNEGFATYAEILWQEHANGANVRELIEDDESVMFVSSLAPRSVEAAKDFDPAVYGGGARALHALRIEIGDEPFFDLVRRWVEARRDSTATTEDFTSLAAEVAGRPLDDFFQTWIYQPNPPELPN